MADLYPILETFKSNYQFRKGNGGKNETLG